MSELILHCPKCAKHDTPKLYINVELGLFNCYRCGDFKGRIKQLYKYPDLIAKIEEQVTLAEYSKLRSFKPVEVKNIDILQELNPVREIYYEDPQYAYLLERGWTDELILLYKPLVSANTDYADRVILPVIVNDEVVYFTARSITSDKGLKYRNPAHVSRKSIVFKSKVPESALYQRDAFIGEGIFDMFKVPNGIAILGKTLSDDNEPNLLSFLAPRQNIYVCLDAGAEAEIETLCAKLLSWFPTKNIYKIDSTKYFGKDLGDLSKSLSSIELLNWVKTNSILYTQVTLFGSVKTRLLSFTK